MTALFDLERRERIGRRTVADYLRAFGFVVDLGVPIVAYVDPHLVGPVERIVARHGGTVHVVPRRLEELTRYAWIDRVGSLPPFDNAHPRKDTALHQIVNWSKLDLLVETIGENPFGTDRFGWIDAGIAHVAWSPEAVPAPSEEVAVLQLKAVAPGEVEDRNAFLRWERGRIAAGFIRGGGAGLVDLADRFDRALVASLEAGVRPTEQAVLGLLTVTIPEAFRFHYGGYRSILRNWDAIRGEVTAVLDNVAHCRVFGLWKEAVVLCEAIERSLAAGVLSVDAENRARWLDEWLVAAWNEGDHDRCRAVAEEIVCRCADTRYWARDRERLERNVAYAAAAG